MLPIRKIAPRIVALSTYYGKTFVQTNTKVSNDSFAWLCRRINLSGLGEGGVVSDLSPGGSFDNEFEAPFIYSALSSEYDSFKVGKLQFDFDRKRILSVTGEETVASIEKKVPGSRCCGYLAPGGIITVDKQNNFHVYQQNVTKPLGDIYGILQLEKEKAPVNFAEVRVYSKYIPVGIVLSYYLGFNNLLAFLGVQYRIVEPRKQKNLTADEYAIVFKDRALVFSKKDVVAALVLSGFNDYEKTLKSFDSEEFNHKDIYLNLLMSKNMGAVYIRELNSMENAFVDPISLEILQDMEEPTTFKGLLVRSCELLTTFTHPLSQDRSAMRDRGYERFAGALYKELTTSIRAFRNKNLVGRSKIDMSPFQVWNAIMKDASIKITEDINPIQNLKESEVVTYSGTGGRDKDSMTKETRAYHKNDFGILSESTVDSTAVGTIAYLSANPNIKNVRGLASEEKTFDATNILSTPALLSPCSTNDEAKRIMFISTQHSHTIASGVYKQPHVRTGYESVIGKRTSKMFSTAAEEDGEVTSVTDRGIIVTYKSGKESGIELGRVYGKAEGTVYPHDIVSPYKLGEKFKKDDILSYNTKFFEPDFIDPKNIIMKINGVARVAFRETNGEHEDSCTISESLGSKATTEVTKIKSYIIDFKQNLVDIKTVGSLVKPKDILMIIADEITSIGGEFSDDALSTLRRLSNSAPKAGLMGKIEKIEVYYHGDKRDMSSTLKKLADKSDMELAKNCKETNKPIVTGRVTDDYRVKGTSLELDKAEVRFYLTSQATTGVGDKVVFGHQMKSTVALVNQSKIWTEEGDVIDATFSYGSICRRGALSPALVGTTITLLDAIGKKAAAIYFGK